MCTWKANPDLMERLATAQNHPKYEHQDILTWAAMCDDRAELLRHVERCEQKCAEYVAPVRPARRKTA